MKFNTDKIEWTDSMKEFAECTVSKKLARIVDEPTNCEIKLTKLNDEKLKITLCVEGLRAQAVDNDFYAGIVAATIKLKAIATKVKSKKSKPKYQQLSINDLGVLDDNKIISDLISKEKVFELKPTTLDCAIDELECTDYPFYVFKDADFDDVISIIYRRYNNTYGLIRCN